MSALVVWVWMADPAHAQSVRVQFDNGHVTLTAQNAPLRNILAEWAKIGGATIINADRVVGGPVTLELHDMPERQALEILLRGVSGYMLAARPSNSAGMSAFDRILILPTSTAPRNPPPVTPPGMPRPVVPQPRIVPESEGEPDLESGGQPQGGVVRRPGIPQPNSPQPFTTPPTEVEEPEEQTPAAEGIPPTPNNPFGVPFGATSRPGVVTPVSQPPNPNRRADQEP